MVGLLFAIVWGNFWLLPVSYRWWWLSATSMFGLWLFAPTSMFMVFGLSLATFYIVNYLRWTRFWIVCLLSQLVYWKAVATTSPVGISFLSFFLLHYTIEQARQNLPTHTVSMFLGRAFFLPIFSAGPIERFQNFIQNQQNKPLWVLAGTRIGLGIFQKWVLAEGALSLFLNGWTGEQLGENWSHLSVLALWGVLAGLFAQLYCDFAGYSNLAIGFSALFGFHIADNFHTPLLSLNPTEFWKRWHISLSSFCQSYVYLPLLGITRNPYVSIWMTFVLMGLWHSMSFKWALWGVLHGTALMLHLRWRRWTKGVEWQQSLWWKGLAWLLLMLFLSLTSALTQIPASHSVSVSFDIISHAFGLN